MAHQKKPLKADLLATDPRIAEAKRLFLDAIADHTETITTIRPPQQDHIASYADLLQRFERCRGGSLYYPYIGSGIGNGAFVELLDGSIKYDLIGGIGVHYWGHSHHQLIESNLDAALSDTILQGNLQQNQDSLYLMELLTATSGLDHCFLTSSGVMANENGIKIAFQKRWPASRVLAFSNNFSGRTLFFSQVSDKPALRKGLPTTATVDYIPFYDHTSPEESLAHSLATLRTHTRRYPGQHAAMIFEMVQGEGGCYPGSHDFFLPLMEECKKEGILVFVDEVQTFGRTSQLYAYQHFGLEEYIDIVSIGKLAQVCATLYRKEISPKPGLISQTVTSSTFAIRAARIMIASMIEGGDFGANGKILHLHQHFVQHLQRLQTDKNLLSGPYGIGCMLAFTPYQGEHERVVRFAKNLFSAGVIGFIAGTNPTRMRFLLPAGALTTEDIDQVALIIRETLEEGAPC